MELSEKKADPTTQILCIELEQSKLLATLIEKINSMIHSFVPCDKGREDIKELEKKFEECLQDYSAVAILCTSLKGVRGFKPNYQKIQSQLDALSDIYFMIMNLKQTTAYVL